MESSGLCLPINNHLLQRSFLQSSLCLSTLTFCLPPFSLSVKICIMNVSSACICLSLHLLSSPASIHLCSHVRVCVFLALCCCVSAVEVILSSLLILAIAFSQEAAAGTEIGRTSSALRNTEGTAAHYSVYCSAWQQL